MTDNVSHPEHYTKPVPGIEAIEVTQHFNFCLGNVIKYVWRFKAEGFLEDLKKAQWYLNREIARREEDNEVPHIVAWPDGIPPVEDDGGEAMLSNWELLEIARQEQEAEMNLNKQHDQELSKMTRKGG